MEFDKNLSTKEVAEILGVSRQTVYEWARISPDAGGLPSFKFGSRVLIRESDLKQWMDNKRRYQFN